jgi:HEPN superfamily RiboL-PSP-like protein
VSTSKRLKDLKREIDRLKKQFLPDPFDPLGNYRGTSRVQAHTRAFLVLSHAEVESYLEEWAKEIARASESVWRTSTKITKPLAFLLGTFADRIALPLSLRAPNTRDGPQRLADGTMRLFEKYYKRIKDNNGIKEQNVLSLFGPLGIPATALGSTLLPNLDNLGAIRGTHAHHSAKAVQSALDPETEYKRITALLADLALFDEWLVAYKHRIR